MSIYTGIPERKKSRKSVPTSADRAMLNSAAAKVGSTFTEPINDTFRENRVIDPRLARGSPLRGRLHRGRMIRKDVASGHTRGILHFLFNPTSVSFSYNIQQDEMPEDLKDHPNDIALLGPVASCSFKLVFDRTYEMLFGNDSLGVLDDVATLEHLMGIFSKNGIISAPKGEPVSVYFGSDRAMKFKGYFTGASVDMTHFTPEMIPVRLVMNVTLRRTQEADSQVAQLSDSNVRGADDVIMGRWGSGSSSGSGSSTPSRSTSEPSGSTSSQTHHSGGRNFLL